MSNTGFNSKVDYFGKASQYLRLISSQSGARSRLTETSHTGGIDASDQGALLLNPVCVYVVVKDTTLDFTLGAAWQAGYMLTSVDIQTRVGQFPLVTFTGTENEGVNAINTWRVSNIAVKARSKAQNLLSALANSTRLNAFNLSARCDPVVLYENNAPCASDVVHGKLFLNANLICPTSSPSVNVNSPWAVTGSEVAGIDADYNQLTINAERSL